MAPWQYDDMNGTAGDHMEPRGWLVPDKPTVPLLNGSNLRGTPSETTICRAAHAVGETGGFFFGNDPSNYLGATGASAGNERTFPNPVYIDYWFYVIPGTDGPHNLKFFRHHAQDGTVNGYWSFPDSSDSDNSNHGGPAGSGPQFGDAALSPSTHLYNQWSHLRVRFNPHTSADGFFQLMRNNVSHMRSTNWNGNNGGTQINFFFETQFLTVLGVDNNGSGVCLYDDVYIDDTEARIEVGNNATYASATHTELQIPTAWADGSVTFTVKRGTFGASDSAWLYVINSSNTVVATQAITFGTTY